jgi:hypothetical protein
MLKVRGSRGWLKRYIKDGDFVLFSFFLHR